MNPIALLQKVTVTRLLMTAAFVVCLAWLLFDPHESFVVGSQVDDSYLPIPAVNESPEQPTAQDWLLTTWIVYSHDPGGS
jgi:hypothetical protein